MAALRAPLLLLGATAGMMVLRVSSLGPAPPRPAKVGCWFVEEAAGGRGGSVMPSDLRQRPALLLMAPPGGRAAAPGMESELPPEVEAGLAFQVLDPSGTLWGREAPGGDLSTPLWLRGGRDPEDGVSCEINGYSPQGSHVPWAAGLEGPEGCPRSMGDGKWFIVTLQSPRDGYGVSAILHAEDPWPRSSGKRQEVPVSGGAITTVTAVLSVFSRTPRLRSRLGRAVALDCGFSGPSSAPFSVEWRHQHGGAGRVVLAYEGATQKVSVAEEGARLLVDPKDGGGGGEVSLLLEAAAVRHEGTYICTVYLPHLHAQQAMELRVLEPPKVTLRPVPLSVAPNAPAELACDVTGYYPQSVSVAWRRRGPGDLRQDLPGSWESGQRESPDGTFSFTSFARLPPVQFEDEGAVVSCHVSHPALEGEHLRKSVALHVAGSSGPSMEDAIGCFLIAFALFGFLQAASRRESGVNRKEAGNESVADFRLGGIAPPPQQPKTIHP